MRLLRTSTGFFLILLFIIIFSFSFIGVTSEYQQVESLDEMLDKSITLDDFSVSSNSYMYDTTGNIISEIYSENNRIYLPYQQIPVKFVEAVIATEDRQFFSHKGFDMNGMTRALFVNAAKQGIKQGGSTITQQLVRNIYLNNERTYNRKLTEFLYAYQLEKIISKEEILELYLNIIYFQNGVYGIEAASNFYFSRSVEDLSIAEIAFLSAIPNNPSLYNPFTNVNNTHQRKEWILTKMLEMSYISEEQFTAATSEQIELTPNNKIDTYPAYVTYIHYELEQLIGEKEGLNEKINNATTAEEENIYKLLRKQRTEELLSSGVHIFTSLQPEKQKKINSVLRQHLPEKNIQGTAVVIDHSNHSIVAISAGKDYQKFDFHRGFQAYRQPGSAIKPLLVYAPYLAEKGASPSSTISAAPFCKNGYCPENYGGTVYGNVRIDTALKYSYNTSAVRMLDKIGVSKGFSYMEQLGLSKIVSQDYRLPAALGGLTYGVTPLEITQAYTIFSNDGKFQKARGIEKVVNRDGEIIYEWSKIASEVWDKNTNEKMRLLLTKVVREGTGKKAYFTSNYIGGKTGTTNDFHDLWFIGLNDKYTTGVWIGHDKPQSLAPINSRGPHLLIWREIMK